MLIVKNQTVIIIGL